MIESAMQEYLGPQGRYILDNLGEDGTLTLAQIGQIYNETKEFIEAKEMEIDIVSKDADREIEKLLKDGHKDKADKKDAATVAQIDKINLSINEEKRKRDVKMKKLERQLTKADTSYDFQKVHRTHTSPDE